MNAHVTFHSNPFKSSIVHSNYKCHPHGGTRRKVSESPKSLGFILFVNVCTILPSLEPCWHGKSCDALQLILSTCMNESDPPGQSGTLCYFWRWGCTFLTHFRNSIIWPIYWPALVKYPHAWLWLHCFSSVCLFSWYIYTNPGGSSGKFRTTTFIPLDSC